MNLLVSMGMQNSSGTNKKSDKAVLQLIDWESGQTLKSLEYISPPEFYPGSRDMLFKAGSIYGDTFVVPTDTELLFISLKDFIILKRITLPSFNDLHHSTVYNGKVYVVNTGLEIVQTFDLEGYLLDEFNTTEEPTWERFDKSVDYRKVESTKPLKTHCNYIFFLDDGSRWVTRFHQKDAMCMDDPTKKIDLNVSEGGPHDGKVVGDFIYFTMTDGQIVIVNWRTLKVEETINLAQIDNRKVIGKMHLGWCRGIHIDGSSAYVGFTRLRSSLSLEYIRWVKYIANPLNSRIVEYDLEKKRLIKEFELDMHKIAGIDSDNGDMGAKRNNV
jgi:hypothetical protein